MKRILLFFTVMVAGHAPAETLSSGTYTITQSWSQEKDFERPYYVNMPEGPEEKTWPMFIFLHGNGGEARRAMKGFMRRHRIVASRYIMVFPNGYRASWNIVSERSKADDLG
ncbi:MAG: hypothetical protein AAF492_03685, partial [Verrucomicrobiota bacterium]